MDLIQKDKKNMYSSLHNKYALVLKKHVFRILEYEVYHWNDPFTHQNERQRNPTIKNERSLCSFYIHRSKKGRDDAYKGGTYKGIDIVIGGGILIRSILCATNNPSNIIEGPSCTVDTLCSLSGYTLKEVEDNLRLIKCKWDTQSEYDHPQYPIYLGSRVGLTLKKVQEDNIEYYAKHLILPLRSSIFVPKKSKETFFITEIDRKDIPVHTDRYYIEYEQGKYRDKISPTMTSLQIAGYLSSH